MITKCFRLPETGEQNKQSQTKCKRSSGSAKLWPRKDGKLWTTSKPGSESNQAYGWHPSVIPRASSALKGPANPLFCRNGAL
ncbi:unnamed protein product [Ceratitis capitata]|uniref:(Mediterranean fruit fly) hypothetical protein n=1 Tax=Ceratitis capitata TaxID=7213 RepID=A0A811UJE3_CERCA|nr:unnamed protein product [Ceratitis capitata]